MRRLMYDIRYTMYDVRSLLHRYISDIEYRTSHIGHQLILLLVALLFYSCSQEDAPWEGIHSEGGAAIHDMYFVNADTAFAVGGVDYESEKILRSTNGGLSWDSLPPYYGQAIFGVDFFDSQHGFTAGIAGKILRTEDGGLNWWIYTMDLFNNLHAVHMLSEKTVIAVGGGSRGEGEIWKSTDRAASWSVDTFNFELLDLVFVDEQVGFACGYGAVLRTEDAGASWEQLDIEGDLFTSMSFPHPDTGYVVGRTGHIARTLDGGDSWETLRNASAFVQNRHKYHDVVFRDGRTGYIVGKKNLILATDNAGKSWQKLQAPVEDDFYTVCLSPDGAIWIAGEKGQIFRLRD